MPILGLCGHVDHGKTTFIQCLTGQDPRRYQEEKQRGMTIDIGFASLGGSTKTGLIDVPGHENYIKNFIVGISGVQGYLFLVAADDGWMPQSEEHLKILKGFQITKGILVITKVDLIDEIKLESLKKEISFRLEEALGESAKVIGFSSKDLAKHSRIREEIVLFSQSLPHPRRQKPARIWIDRVFSPVGKGVTVTGSLGEGSIKIGDSLQAWPGNHEVSVRSIESYRESKEEAHSGTRVAAQLSKITLSDLHRGSLLTKERAMLTSRVDAYVTASEARQSPRKSSIGDRTSVIKNCLFYKGTLRKSAKFIFFEKIDEEKYWARLAFNEPIPLRAGEKFIIRSSGDEKTLGSGTVIDPHTRMRPFKWFTDAANAWKDSATGLVSFKLKRDGYVDIQRLEEESIYESAELGENQSKGIVFDTEVCDLLFEYLKQKSTVKQKEIPSIRKIWNGLAVEEILANFVFHKKCLFDKNQWVFVEENTRSPLLKKVLQKIESGNGMPVSFKGEDRALKQNAWELVRKGELTGLKDEHFWKRDSYCEYKSKIVKMFDRKSEMTTSEVRQLLGWNRKYTVLLLEKMDEDRVTYLKEGTRRLLKSPA